MKTFFSITRSPLLRTTHQIETALDRHFWLGSLLFVLSFFICSVIQDVRLKMWTDELFTLYVAQEKTPRAIVKITSEFDVSAPLYPMIAAAIRPMVRQDALAVRLPSTIGFCAMLLCVLGFCRGRMPRSYAFLAAFLAGIECSYYATEGRCYGMVLGFAAAALLCWRGAIESRFRSLSIAGLALCLAMMTALHYYSVFYLVPFAAAEVVRWYVRRTIDWAVGAAILAPVFMIGIHYPLIAAGRRYAVHFWPMAVASWSQVPTFYIYYCFLPLCAMLAALMILGLISDEPILIPAIVSVLPRHEWVFLGVLATMPLVMVGISKYTTHVFVYRYALWAIIGLALLSAATLCLMSSGRSEAGVLVAGSLFVVLAVQLGLNLTHGSLLRETESVNRQLQALADGQLPIAFNDEHLFLEMSYYADSRLRRRIVYPLSGSLDLQYKGFDSDSYILSALGRHGRLNVMEFDAFLAANAQFLLAVKSKNYLPSHLRAAGYQLTPLSSSLSTIVYEVSAPAPH
jgi:hypothetical protein